MSLTLTPSTTGGFEIPRNFCKPLAKQAKAGENENLGMSRATRRNSG
jgi:hypothetical protein